MKWIGIGIGIGLTAISACVASIFNPGVAGDGFLATILVALFLAIAVGRD